jgi:hypothetical protein
MKPLCNDKSREESFPVMWLVIPGSEAVARRESDDVNFITPVA